MKLTTIWTLPATSLRERLKRTRELLDMKLARLIPKRLAYWSFIHAGVAHIKGDEIVPDVPYTTVLSRLGGAPR